MREIRIEKLVLNCSGIGDKIERAGKLLKFLTNKKPMFIKSKRRIPAFNVRPGIVTGCKVTIRNKKEIEALMKKLLAALENKLKKKQFRDGFVSFGIKEYIEIPGVEYQRDIGIVGLDATLVLKRSGERVARRKNKKGPVHQKISSEETRNFIKEKFNVEIK